MLTDTSWPTVNRTGWGAKEPHEINLAFAEYAGMCMLPVLDIGSGFGPASIEAVRRGGNVIVNDMAPEHLEHIRAQIASLGLPQPRFLPGRVPGDISLPAASLGAVHASNLFHFLTPREFERALSDIHRWLTPAGKLFVLTGTPYQGHLRGCSAIFDSRNNEGQEWPGWFEDVGVINESPLLELIPKAMLMFDVETLSEKVTQMGFVVEQAHLYTRKGIPGACRLDGRENLYMIARKS